MKKAVLLIFIFGVAATSVYFAFGRDKGTEQKNVVETSTPRTDEAPPDNVQQGGQNPASADSEAGSEISQIVAGADALAASGAVLAARNKYSDALTLIVRRDAPVENREQTLDALRGKLRPLNDLIYGDRTRIFEGQSYYEVQRGDNSTKIAGQHKLTPEYLMNRLNGRGDINLLRAGEKLKVIEGPFHAVVDLSDRRIYVFHGEYYYKDFEISVGKAGRETPPDNYLVADKMREGMPSFKWTDPDTGEVFSSGEEGFMLGTRWIKLKGDRVGDQGIGIHGRRPSEDSQPLGEAVSRGCVRMRNSDVEELYDLLVTGQSTVIVKD